MQLTRSGTFYLRQHLIQVEGRRSLTDRIVFEGDGRPDAPDKRLGLVGRKEQRVVDVAQPVFAVVGRTALGNVGGTLDESVHARPERYQRPADQVPALGADPLLPGESAPEGSGTAPTGGSGSLGLERMWVP